MEAAIRTGKTGGGKLKLSSPSSRAIVLLPEDATCDVATS